MTRITPPAPNIRFLIVTGFTGMNLMLGLLAMFYATRDLMLPAACCLLACVVLDACDGNLARRWDVSSPFGAQLDSLADFTSFCIASGALAYYWFSGPETPFYLIAGASCFYVFTGAVRLARFNVTSDPLCPPQYFQGMPTTAVSAVVAIAYLTYPQLASSWGVALVVLLGILMVSVFPYPKTSRIAKAPAWFWVAVVLAALVNPSWTAWALALAYMLSGPFIWARRRHSERRQTSVQAA